MPYDSSIVTAYGNLGSVLRAQGRSLEAEAAFQRALHYRPNMAEVHYNFFTNYRDGAAGGWRWGGGGRSYLLGDSFQSRPTLGDSPTMRHCSILHFGTSAARVV
ncbi:Transmembrane and TPR repeat-containing protein CG4341 [Eumeta japonica]|uniref:Transmembrane and TPR repeat-containing protein CG4341 n=1 Tax=Eumeta variegata TaxID=151549 RepID=A0A4C1Z887_EUMVA|nr:Transmembrane and TPR repeat-containing protein CG4341 [Eumeta japonica]